MARTSPYLTKLWWRHRWVYVATRLRTIGRFGIVSYKRGEEP